MNQDHDTEGELPPVYPLARPGMSTQDYVWVYRRLNATRHLTEVIYETLGQRMAREQQEQSK